MTSCRTETVTLSRMEESGLFDCCCMMHPSVSGFAVYLRVSRAQWLTVDIFSTFYGVFMVYCPKLMLSKFVVFATRCDA